MALILVTSPTPPEFYRVWRAGQKEGFECSTKCTIAEVNIDMFLEFIPDINTSITKITIHIFIFTYISNYSPFGVIILGLQI